VVVISEYKRGREIDVNELHIKERKVTFETKWDMVQSSLLIFFY
jgi:hypothetical protein